MTVSVMMKANYFQVTRILLYWRGFSGDSLIGSQWELSFGCMYLGNRSDQALDSIWYARFGFDELCLTSNAEQRGEGKQRLINGKWWLVRGSSLWERAPFEKGLWVWMCVLHTWCTKKSVKVVLICAWNDVVLVGYEIESFNFSVF